MTTNFLHNKICTFKNVLSSEGVSTGVWCVPECTKIAHRRSLAIFIADEGIARNSAVRTIFSQFLPKRNRGSLAIFFAEELAHLGASSSRPPRKIARFLGER